MVGKMLVAVVLVIGLLAFAQQQRVFHKWGVVGSCQATRSPVGDTSAWYACKEGLLTGFPTLLSDDCTYETRVRDYEYWRCPAPLDRLASGS